MSHIVKNFEVTITRKDNKESWERLSLTPFGKEEIEAFEVNIKNNHYSSANNYEGDDVYMDLPLEQARLLRDYLNSLNL